MQKAVEVDLINLSAMMPYWENIESLYLEDTSQGIGHRFKSLEAELVKLYSSILELIVEIQASARDGVFSMMHTHPITHYCETT
jgi:hypothetical protein